MSSSSSDFAFNNKLIQILNILDEGKTKEDKLDILAIMCSKISERTDLKDQNGQRMVRLLAAAYYYTIINCCSWSERKDGRM